MGTELGKRHFRMTSINLSACLHTGSRLNAILVFTTAPDTSEMLPHKTIKSRCCYVEKPGHHHTISELAEPGMNERWVLTSALVQMRQKERADCRSTHFCSNPARTLAPHFCMSTRKPAMSLPVDLFQGYGGGGHLRGEVGMEGTEASVSE